MSVQNTAPLVSVTANPVPSAQQQLTPYQVVHPSGVGYRSSPTMNARVNDPRGPPHGAVIGACAVQDGWIQDNATKLWLPIRTGAGPAGVCLVPYSGAGQQQPMQQQPMPMQQQPMMQQPMMRQQPMMQQRPMMQQQPMMQRPAYGQPQYMQPRPYPMQGAVGGAMDGEVGYGGAVIPGLCSCMDDTDACLIAWCAPAIVAGRTADAVEPGSYKKGCGVYACLSMFGCGECYQGCCLSKELYAAYPKPDPTSMTGNAEPNGCMLCLCHCCCLTSCCTKVQEVRYIKNLRAKGLLRNQATTTGRRPGPVQQRMY